MPKDEQVSSLVTFEKIEAFLSKENILPGKNCFLTGKDKGQCFENKRLMIKLSSQDLVNSKKMRLQGGGVVHFTAEKGEEEELLVLFKLENWAKTPKISLEKALNQVLLQSCICIPVH